MGPPPPSPRIEGQQHQHPRNHYNKPRAPVTSAAPISSYASLASAPPPSFARKTSTSAVTNNSTSNANAERTTATSAASDHLYRNSPRGTSTSYVGRGGRSSGRTRYDGGGGRSVGGRGPRGPYRGGGGRGRYDDRFSNSRSGSTSSLGGDRPSGRGRGDGEGGRFSSYRRGGRDPSSSGRFDGTSRGRGRGRDYMSYGGRGGRGGRSYHRGGRGGYNREDGGRGRYSDYAGAESSFSSFADNNSVGESNPRSTGFSDELPAEGPSPGEVPIRKTYQRSSITSSDGGRSASPHPAQTSGYGARRTFGSFSNTSNSNMNESAAEFGRSGSQEGEPGEEDPNSYYPAKRRREDSYAAAAEESEPPKRVARDPSDPPSEGGPPTLPFGPSTDGGDGPPSAESNLRANANDPGEDSFRNSESRLAEEGRWTSPSGVSRDSPHSTRHLYSSGQFDDTQDSYRDSYVGRGRGRGRGRGNYRPGRGRGDYSRNSSDYGGSREYGGRYSDRDRRPSATLPPDGARGSENSPRPFSFSDLASSSAPSWKRHDSNDVTPLSPRGNDWRKPVSTPRVISSYATLAAGPPPPRPSPSSPNKTIQAPVVRAPTPEPEKAKTPPPSPGPPSGYTTARTRLADLEAQMEFAYAKHILLVKRHQVLMAQYDHLEGLPVGLEAFQVELEALVGAEKANSAEDAALYGA